MTDSYRPYGLEGILSPCNEPIFDVSRIQGQSGFYGEMLGCSSIRPHEISRSEPLSQSHLLMWFLYNYAEFGFYQQVLPTFCWARGETAGIGPVLRGPEVVPLSVSRFPVAVQFNERSRRGHQIEGKNGLSSYWTR